MATQPVEKQPSKSKKNEPKATDYESLNPVYYGGEELRKFVEKNFESFHSEPYSVNEMKEIIKPYCKRIIKASGSVNRKTEALVIGLSKKTLKVLLKNTRCEGLMAVLSINLDKKDTGKELNQTFILIPVDNKGKAIELDDAQGYYGKQRWPASQSMDEIIADGQPDSIQKNLDRYFSSVLSIPEEQ